MAVQRDKVIASAEKLVAKGKIAEAIKEYERLIEDSPNDVNTLNRIGDLWVRINNNNEAVKVFTKIADHYSKDGFFLKAIAIYKKINKLDPSKLDVYAKLADLYAKQGLAMEAKSQYQVLADYYLKHGDPGNALAIYRKITELDPNSINVHVKLADLYSQNNQTAEALKEYDRVGRMLLKRGMLDEAVQVFKKALRIDAKNTDLVESLVTALLESRDYNNATQIVETALEINRDHPKLLAIWSRIQLAKGDAASARSTLERALAANPDEPLIRETLADIYLKQSDAGKALSMLAPLSEKALGRGDRNVAIEFLNRVLRVDSGHPATLEKLVATYVKLNEETNILASMNSLAEAHIAKGDFVEAARVLDKLIEREPQNAQHRNKLQFVKSNISGVETLPVTPAADAPEPPPPPPMPSLEIEEPMPSFDLDLDSSEPVEISLPEPEPERKPEPVPEAPKPVPPPPKPAAEAPPQARLPAAVDLAAADLASDEDLDFITEHLTEAEVFAKYGLAEKAIDHLRAIIARAPKHQVAHERLYRLLLEEGDVDSARTIAQSYVGILKDLGDEGQIETVKGEFMARGHSLETARAAGVEEPAAETFELPELEPELADLEPEPEAELEPVAPSPPTPAAEIPDDELTFDLEPSATDFALEDQPTEFVDIDTEPAQETEPEEPAVAEEEPVAASSAASFGDDSEELSFEAPEGLTFDFGEADEVAAPEPEPVVESKFDFGLVSEEEMAAASADEQPFFGVEGGEDLEGAGGPQLEELGEIDFYIGQELFDEARAKVAVLLAKYPGDETLLERRDRVEAAAESVAAQHAAIESGPGELSRDAIETELMSAIPDEDEEIAAPPPPPPAEEVELPPIAVPEENLFADEDDFFDLASELESELTSDEQEPLSLSEEEQSLEQIFKEFKKGVEQQLDSEDYDTHYNLGIAYKEMGLTDEAIGEFQLASKDPKRAVECASMLGLCFLEKGMPQLAIKWYRKGIEMPEITEEEHVGLLYDLGSAYLEVGDTTNAQKAFMEVYGMNTNYRDVVTRIKQLQATK